MALKTFGFSFHFLLYSDPHYFVTFNVEYRNFLLFYFNKTFLFFFFFLGGVLLLMVSIRLNIQNE